MSNLRDKIREKRDTREAIVHVPEWDCDILVRGLKARERDNFEDSLISDDGKGNRRVDRDNARARLAIETCYEPETKERLFQPGDEAWLGEKTASAIERLFDTAQKLSGMTDGDIDELVKNSEATPADSSSTG